MRDHAQLYCPVDFCLKMYLSQLPFTARLLIASRFLRSVGQGALVVGFALYLHALQWSAAAIGAVFMAGLVFTALLTLLLGPMSDRYGRRGFLLGYELSQTAVALLALSTAHPWLLGIAAVIGGFGRGANGSPGPFLPVEQAWLMQGVAPKQRGMVFSFNSAMGFFGMALGAVLAGLPEWLSTAEPQPEHYRVLFLIVLLGSFGSLLLLLLTKEQPTQRPGQEAELEQEQGLSRAQENRLLLRLVLVNMLSGIGLGLVGPLIAYWFNLRFGVGPGSIAPVMAAAFAATGFGALLSGRLTKRHGVVRSVVGLNLLGLLMLLPMALAPSFFWAATFFIVRSALSRGTVGARQALGISLVNSQRSGFAASLNTVSMMLPFAVGPMLAGMFFQAGMLLAPFLLGSLVQAGYLFLYYRFFAAHDPGRSLKAQS